MHSRRVVFLFVASLSAIAVAACATGTVPVGGGGSSGNGDGTGDAGGSAYGGDEGGLVIPDGGLTHPEKDSGTITPIDSGTSGPPDSGSTGGGSFCVGQTSTKRNDFGTKKYDDWCDENATVGVDFTCTDNSQCSGNFTSSYEPECCYQPIAGGYCESDYGGGAQCVPQ